MKTINDPSLAPGDYLADLHDGWAAIRKQADIRHIVEFDFNALGGGSSHWFVGWLSSVRGIAKPNDHYMNKYLLVVAVDPFIVAAWCYDGRHGGTVQFKPWGAEA